MTDVLTPEAVADIRARVERLIAGPHDWFKVDGEPVKAVMFTNESTVDLATLLHENAPRLLSHVAAVEQNLEAGTRELRRYVEGNGFTWCEDESTVFNVTTAIGWLGGALETANKQLAAVEAERDRLREDNAALSILVKDADVLFGAGWQEAMKAMNGKPHEAAHAQCARLAGAVAILKTACELADFWGDFGNHPKGQYYVRDEIRAALSETPR